MTLKHASLEDLEAGLDMIRDSPRDEGIIEMIVRRPEVEEREILDEGELTATEGLSGDCWKTRGCPRTPDGSSDSNRQLTLMNSRAMRSIAPDRERWPLAGDQLFLDMDLTLANLPPGTQLRIGTAILEITDPPHNGCKKFANRFGVDAMRFFGSKVGKELRLRGIYAKVIGDGRIKVGDLATKIQR